MALDRLHTRLQQQNDRQLQQTTESLRHDYEEEQLALQENHAHQMQSLMALVEEKDRELEELREQQRANTLKQAEASAQRERELLESVIVQCDDQIADASKQLEGLLQTAEDDILAARFGAAQFLVNAMLQQKLHHANERVGLQSPTTEDSANVSPNVRFLLDMIQQRLARLQQLHQSLAKLAAMSPSYSVDPERLRHASFLSDALFQRQQRHVSFLSRLA